eukprot:SAG31_NODE_3935_length_3737_cov_1.467565_2_plen_56_part_00
MLNETPILVATRDTCRSKATRVDDLVGSKSSLHFISFSVYYCTYLSTFNVLFCNF